MATLKEFTFSIGKNLKLPGSQQSLSYFNDTNQYPPIVEFILTILNFATSIMGTLAVIIMILAGFVMLLSQGDQTRIDRAKDMFKYAIIGLIVAFLSYIIVISVQSLFNVN